MASFNNIRFHSAPPSHAKETCDSHCHFQHHTCANSHGRNSLKILDFQESFQVEVENYKKRSDKDKELNRHQASNQNDNSIIPSRPHAAKATKKYRYPEPWDDYNSRNEKPLVHRESGGKAQQQSHVPSKQLREEAVGTTKRQQYAHTNDKSSTSAGTNDRCSSPIKVIINQFHARSLHGSPHNVGKAKIPTSNDLTDEKPGHQPSISAPSPLPKNYYAKTPTNTRAGHPKQSAVRISDDDPCNAVDEVDHYSDSDSEEDRYVGHPFYINGDQEGTQQSLSVRSSISFEGEESSQKYFTPKCVLSPSLFPNVPPYVNFASHSKKGTTMPAALRNVLIWKLCPGMPTIVRHVVQNTGFRIHKRSTEWLGTWDSQMRSARYRNIRPHQKFNHLPGTYRISRKDSIWRVIHSHIEKYGTSEFGFMQKTYIMPEDIADLRQVWPKNVARQTKWIVKPPASARGTGIHVVNKWSQFSKERPLVVQKYIEHPFLINDNKFDMRLYVVVTSVDPLKIYMYKDGLVRFASVKYDSEMKSLDNRCMHLTNYSINKNSEWYSKNQDFNSCQGHKWTLQSLWSCLESRGVDTKRLWATLRNLVIKSIICGEYVMTYIYRQNVNSSYNCYELFGFDVLLDNNMVPWLLEINVSPSLHSDLAVDQHVKGPLIQALFNTALYQVPPKLTEQEQADIIQELNVDCTGLCMDKRLFSTDLTPVEKRKHRIFGCRSKDYRSHYLKYILEELMPGDVRCLIIAEDELNRCTLLERVFPTAETYEYLQFLHRPRYYNRLLDAWENSYGNRREEGIALLRSLCEEGYHLKVAEVTKDHEPNSNLSNIDLLHDQAIDQSEAISTDDTNMTENK